MPLIRIWNSFHYILSTDVTKRSKRSMSNCINFLKFCDVHGGLTCVCKQSLARTGQDAPRALALSTDKLINFDKRTQTFRYSLSWSDCMSKNREFIISQKSHTLVYSTRFVFYMLYIQGRIKFTEDTQKICVYKLGDTPVSFACQPRFKLVANLRIWILAIHFYYVTRSSRWRDLEGT